MLKVLTFISKLYLYKVLVIPVLALFTYESSFNSTISFLLAAFAGNFLGVEWYTLHLFDFFVSIDSLANVFKSVLKSIGVLSLLSVLLGIFILVFNVISLSVYANVVYEGE